MYNTFGDEEKFKNEGDILCTNEPRQLTIHRIKRQIQTLEISNRYLPYQPLVSLDLNLDYKNLFLINKQFILRGRSKLIQRWGIWKE